MAENTNQHTPESAPAANSKAEKETTPEKGAEEQGYAQNDYSGTQFGNDGAKTHPTGQGAHSSGQDNTTGTGGVAGGSQASGSEGGYETPKAEPADGNR